MSENAKMRKAGGKGGAAGIVREIAETVADELGYYVWDVEYVKEGARRILRITIDNEEGEGRVGHLHDREPRARNCKRNFQPHQPPLCCPY